MKNPPIKNEEGTWAIHNEQKVTKLAEHLEYIFQPNTPPYNERLDGVGQLEN